MRYLAIVLVSTCVLVAFGCTKDLATDCLIGTTWVPVHAVGGYEGVGYTITWDSDVNGDGTLLVKYERDGESIDYLMAFSGFKFYKEGKDNVYATFSPANPETFYSSSLRYYIKDDRIYFEKTFSSGSSWSSSMKEDESETHYVSSALVEFSTDSMTFDGVTYRRIE